MTARERLIRVQDDPPVDLFARERVGEPGRASLVFLHGFPEFSGAWEWYLEYFGERGYWCLAPDLRGYGQSSKPEGTSSYEIDRLVADADVLVEDCRRRSHRVYLIGHDWGGAIVWEYAAQHPENVAGVIVLNSPHRGAFAANTRRDRALYLRQHLRSWYIFFFQLPWLPEMALRAFDFWWVERAFRTWAVRDDVFTPEYLARCKASLRIPGALTSAVNYYRANATGRYGREILEHRAGRFDFPPVETRALLLWGAQDRALDRRLIRGIDAFFPRGIHVKEYKGASHWINHEHPGRVAAEIETFVLATSGEDAARLTSSSNRP